MKPYNGRKKIILAYNEVTKDNILNVLSDAFAIHEVNAREMRYLREYYKGNQPILERTKKVRDDICNRIVENRAYEIVEFKKGYVFGEPIQFVQRGDCAYTEENEMSKEAPRSVQALNELMSSESKDMCDADLGEDMFILGTAYRFIFTKSGKLSDGEAPFKMCALDPEYTFIVYSVGAWQEPILSVNYVDCKSTSMSGTQERRITAYTNDKVFEITLPLGTAPNNVPETSIVKESVNGIGMNPIIEYPLNRSRIGCFEPVLSLLDAINNSESNRMDGIEQFVQSFIKFINCDITKNDFEDLKRKGAIVLNGIDGQQPDAQIMESSLDQQQTQTHVENLYTAILTICGVPDRNASSGGNTGQALIIGEGWASAEARAKAVETMFKYSERKFLKVVLAILQRSASSNLPEAISSLRLDDIDIKFTRNRTDSLLVKTQGLQNLLEAGVHPRIALSNVGLFSDPEQVYADSIEYLDKWLNASQNTSEALNSGSVDGISVPSNNKSADEPNVNPTVEVTG